MEFDKHDIIEISPIIHRIRLFKLARRLNVNAEVLVGILKEAGYNLVGNRSQIILDENQLKIISNAYSRSVRDLFKKCKRPDQIFSQEKKSALTNFFGLFVSGFDANIQDDIFCTELDNDLIEAHFYALVETANFVARNNFHWKYVRIRISIVKSFNAIHKKIIATFIRYCYYNFSIDEDSLGSKRICFS
ncbi:MAG: hypothetical protein JSR97_00220 [Verrucomicrobia bacterium]|nr:hypothetical protein [Verrucomicrobiota bacterium]